MTDLVLSNEPVTSSAETALRMTQTKFTKELSFITSAEPNIRHRVLQFLFILLFPCLGNMCYRAVG
jgi:hypothetical protein